MSRSAVSCEHLASLDHFDVVSLPTTAVQHGALTVVERFTCNRSPEGSLPQYSVEQMVGFGNRSVEAAKEPGEPWSDVEAVPLGRLQDVVVAIALATNLR